MRKVGNEVQSNNQTYHHSTSHGRHKSAALSLSSIGIWSISIFFIRTSDTFIIRQSPFTRIRPRCGSTPTFFLFLWIDFTLVLLFRRFIFALLFTIRFGSPSSRSWTRQRLIFRTGCMKCLRSKFLKQKIYSMNICKYELIFNETTVY